MYILWEEHCIARGGGGYSHIKVTGVLVGFFESDP